MASQSQNEWASPSFTQGPPKGSRQGRVRLENVRRVENRSGFGIVQANEFQDLGRGPFEELCELASKAVGVRFSPFVATSYRELSSALESGELDLAWLPPIPTIDLIARDLASPLAIPARRGATTYHAALIVRRGGPKSIEGLRGRRAAWVQRDSAAGYLVPRMNLAAKGHDVLRFFARELFVHSHASVVDAVVNGDADVGATYCHVDANGNIARSSWVDEGGRVMRPLDALTTFGPIPNDALVGSNELPAATRAGVTRWLLALDPASRGLFERLLGASDFRVPSPEHYVSLEHALRAARARGHDALPPESRRSLRTRTSG